MLKVDEQVREFGRMTGDGDHLGVTQLTRVGSAAVTTGAVISLVLMIDAEVIASSVSVLGGVLLDCALLISFATSAYLGQSHRVRQIYLAFTLLPLMRILSIALVVPHLLPYLRYMLIGLPILVTALVVNRAMTAGSAQSRLNKTERVWQVSFAAVGIPLGFAAYAFLPQPVQFVYPSNALTTLLVWTSLTVFGSITEEIVFRGVLQKALFPAFGFFGIAISSVLYASMFIGTLSPVTVVFYLIIGLVFGFWARATRSIAGPILAHILMNAILLALMTVL